MKRGLRRAATSRRVVILALLLLVVGPVGGTYAYFNASTVNQTSAFAGGWVGEATGLGTPAAVGLDASLSWTKATHVDTVTAQTLYGVDRGSTSNCIGATFGAGGTSAGTGTSYTTTGNGSTLNGHYYCYQLKTADNNWVSSGTVFPVAHLGLFPTSITIDGSAGAQATRADPGDTITIVFNQSVATASLPASGAQIDVCFVSSTVIIGDTAGCAGTSDGSTVGVVTGMTFTGSFNADTSVLTLVNSTTVKVTLGTTGKGRNANSNAISTVTSGALTAATTIQSSATTDQASACTNSTYGCVPSATGTF